MRGTLLTLAIALAGVGATSAQLVSASPAAGPLPSNFNEIKNITNGEVESLQFRVIAVSGPHLIVAIDDPNYHRVQSYDMAAGNFVTTSDNFKRLVIEDYPDVDTAAIDQRMTLTAQRVGTIVKSHRGQPVVLELWNCRAAKLQSKADLSKNRSEAMYAALAAEQRAQARQEVAKAKADAARARTLKQNQEAAAQGDAYGLLRMGERYRDGDGVPRDLAQARDYLARAAAAGSATAKDALAHLPEVAVAP